MIWAMMIRRSPAGNNRAKAWRQRLPSGLVQGSGLGLTRDDFADFVRVVAVPAEEVGEPHDHQPQDGDEDADPLAGSQAAAQEGDGEQAGEDDDGPTQHLETGSAGHVESCSHRRTDARKETKRVRPRKVIHTTAEATSSLRTHQHTWWRWPSCRTWQVGKRGAGWSFGPGSSWALSFVCHGKVGRRRRRDSSTRPETSPRPTERRGEGGDV